MSILRTALYFKFFRKKKRILPPTIFLFQYLTRKIINLNLFLATTFSAFCWDFYSLAIYSAVFGFNIGAYVGLTSVILVDLLGLDRLTNAFGLLLLFQGIASLIGPPIAGKKKTPSSCFLIPYKFGTRWPKPIQFSEKWTKQY